MTFSPGVLPRYLRRTKAIEELIPWLYLKGISTGDFSEALQSLVGEQAKGLSANVVVRPALSDIALVHTTSFVRALKRWDASNICTTSYEDLIG